MKLSLATSLHLNHGAMSPDVQPGDRVPLQPFVPVGLLALKAYLDATTAGLDTRVVELNGLVNAGAITNDADFYEHLVDAVHVPGDDVVGFMTDADSLHHTLAMAQTVKRRDPSVRIVLGGPASSPMADTLLARFDCLDFIVRGEGEITAAEMLAALRDERPPAGVLGLTWRAADGTIVEEPGRTIVPDLDELPIPAFEAYDMAAGADLYLDVGRGCPFKCDFCATAPFWQRRYRMKSIDRIVAEMTRMRDDYGRRHINFSHDIFTCQRHWTEQFCDRLTADDLGITWTCSTRTDISRPELIERMAAAGCVEIYYGIESGSDAIQRAINKNLDLDWSREIIRATANAGIRPIFGFIVGYPMETRKTLHDTLTRYFEFLDAGGRRGHLFTLCPFHEAPMYKTYGHLATRAARDYTLPLVDGSRAVAEAMKAAHPDVFASLHRYETAGLDAALVEASEEISAGLTVLKPLWPQLLPLYASPLELYERWTRWIGEFNARERPTSPTPLQGTPSDLLRFLEHELERLGVAGSELAATVRYERLKHDAVRSLAAAGPLPDGRAALTPDAILRPRCEFMLEPVDGRWMVLAKPRGDNVNILRVDEGAWRILSAVERAPLPVFALATLAARDADGLDIVERLVEHGLLEVAA